MFRVSHKVSDVTYSFLDFLRFLKKWSSFVPLYSMQKYSPKSENWSRHLWAKNEKTKNWRLFRIGFGTRQATELDGCGKLVQEINTTPISLGTFS